jgi:hypothetical protein
VVKKEIIKQRACQGCRSAFPFQYFGCVKITLNTNNHTNWKKNKRRSKTEFVFSIGSDQYICGFYVAMDESK